MEGRFKDCWCHRDLLPLLVALLLLIFCMSTITGGVYSDQLTRLQDLERKYTSVSLSPLLSANRTYSTNLLRNCNLTSLLDNLENVTNAYLYLDDTCVQFLQCNCFLEIPSHLESQLYVTRMVYWIAISSLIFSGALGVVLVFCWKSEHPACYCCVPGHLNDRPVLACCDPRPK